MEEIEEKKICLGSLIKDRDRISKLPDSVLHRILSFFDTKFAAQTSVLSKRWKYVWTSVPCFKFIFNIDHYVNPKKYYGDAWNKLYDLKKMEFSNFVEKVLIDREGSEIKKFVFVCDIELEPSLIKSILCWVVRHKVREVELDIECSSYHPIQIPQCLYTCESLEKLKLVDPHGAMVLSKTTGFRALRELRLHGFSFSKEDKYPNEDIFPRCLVLEFLSLINCSSWGNQAMITAPRLKKMEILYPSCDSNGFKICAPMLSYFKFEGFEPMRCLMDANNASLVEVDIDIHADLAESKEYKYYHQNPIYNEEDIADGICSTKKWRIKRLVEMLREFGNAKSVVISLKTLEVLSDICGLLEGEASPFPNLKNIKLKTGWSRLLPGWNFLLKETPDAKASLQGTFARLR